jgi:hypothetical protein
MQQAFSVPADASVCLSTGQQYPSTTQQYPSSSILDIVGSCSSQALTAVGSAASIPQDGVLMQGVVMQGGASYQTAVLMPSATAAPRVSYSLSDAPAAVVPGIVSGSVLLLVPHSGRGDLLSQANALGMSEQDLLSAVAAAYSSNTGTPEAQQDELIQHINRLSLLKQVLQLKHQHKVQQCMLQLQQQQQVLASTDRSAAPVPFSSDSMQLQQGLLQMLQHNEGFSGLLLSGTTAAVAAYSDGAMSMPTSNQSSLTTCTNPAAPNMLSWLQQSQQPALQQQQVQLDPVVLPAQTAASLGFIARASLPLRHQQVQQTVLSAPSTVMVTGGDPTQCMVVPSWV